MTAPHTFIKLILVGTLSRRKPWALRPLTLMGTAILTSSTTQDPHTPTSCTRLWHGVLLCRGPAMRRALTPAGGQVGHPLILSNQRPGLAIIQGNLGMDPAGSVEIGGRPCHVSSYVSRAMWICVSPGCWENASSRGQELRPHFPRLQCTLPLPSAPNYWCAPQDLLRA